MRKLPAQLQGAGHCPGSPWRPAQRVLLLASHGSAARPAACAELDIPAQAHCRGAGLAARPPTHALTTPILPQQAVQPGPLGVILRVLAIKRTRRHPHPLQGGGDRAPAAAQGAGHAAPHASKQSHAASSRPWQVSSLQRRKADGGQQTSHPLLHREQDTRSPGQLAGRLSATAGGELARSPQGMRMWRSRSRACTCARSCTRSRGHSRFLNIRRSCVAWC